MNLIFKTAREQIRKAAIRGDYPYYNYHQIKDKGKDFIPKENDPKRFNEIFL